MPRSKNPLTPPQRHERAIIAANARWAHEPDRLAATKPGRDAAFQKLLDEVDPHRELTEAERLKRVRNLQAVQMARLRFLASKARRRRAGLPEEPAVVAGEPQ